MQVFMHNLRILAFFTFKNILQNIQHFLFPNTSEAPRQDLNRLSMDTY